MKNHPLRLLYGSMSNSSAPYRQAIDVARATLQYLVDHGIPPTPENYAAAFANVSGAQDPGDRLVMLESAVRLVRSTMAALALLTAGDAQLRREIYKLSQLTAKPVALMDPSAIEQGLKRILELRDQFSPADMQDSLRIKGAMLRMMEPLMAIASELDIEPSALALRAASFQAARSPTEVRRTVEELLSDLAPIVRAAGTIRRRLDTAEQQVRDSMDRIAVLNSKLSEAEHLVMQDPLTQVFNRRGLMHIMNKEHRSASRTGDSLVVGLLDLDHFKKLNDTLGHAAGDEALVYFARILITSLRPTDSIARYGGEEFAVLMADTPLDKAEVALQRVRASLKRTPFTYRGELVALDFSAGLAEWPKEESAESALERADSALYAAKSAGRGRTQLAR